MEKEIFKTFTLESKFRDIIEGIVAESGEVDANLRPLDIAKLIVKAEGDNWTKRIENALKPMYQAPFSIKGLKNFENSLIAAVKIAEEKGEL